MNTIHDVMRLVAEKVAAEAEEAGQLSLGALIAGLKAMPQDKPARTDMGGGLADPHSYRGFYEQLSFEGTATPGTVAELLADAEAARGQTFTGYKGGEYRMTGTTMVWLAAYGCCGRRIVGLENTDDAVVIRTAAYED